MATELSTVNGHISRRRRLVPQVVGCFRIDDELLAYLRAQIQRRWPACRVDATTALDALERWQVDLWLTTCVPSASSPAPPLLVLSAPSRRAGLERIGPRQWQLPAPFIGDILVDALTTVWTTSREEKQ